jgi:hypothetical protein
MDWLRDIDSLSARLDAEREAREACLRDIEADARKLAAALEYVRASWSGSNIGNHADLYFDGFERPDHQHRFDPDVGTMYGLPEGWSERSFDEVARHVEAAAAVELRDVEKRAAQQVAECTVLRDEVMVSLAPVTALVVGLDHEKKLLDDLESHDWGTLRGVAIPGGVTSDMRAVSQGQRLAPHQRYALRVTHAEKKAEACRRFLSKAHRAARQTAVAVRADPRAVAVGTDTTDTVTLRDEVRNGQSRRPSWKLSALGAALALVFGGLIFPGFLQKRSSDLAASIEVRNGVFKVKDIPDRQPYIDEVQLVDTSQPTIFVNVRNDGNLGTAIDRIRLFVEDVVKLPDCEPSGGSGVVRTWKRGVVVRQGLRPGDTLQTDKRLISPVKADETVSFELRLRPTQALVSEGVNTSSYLYRFRVELRQVSDATWRAVGQAMVALPEVPTGDLDNTVAFIADCTAANRRRLQNVVDKGDASGEMSDLLRACRSGRCTYSDDRQSFQSHP